MRSRDIVYEIIPMGRYYPPCELALRSVLSCSAYPLWTSGGGARDSYRGLAVTASAPGYDDRMKPVASCRRP